MLTLSRKQTIIFKFKLQFRDYCLTAVKLGEDLLKLLTIYGNKGYQDQNLQ